MSKCYGDVSNCVGINTKAVHGYTKFDPYTGAVSIPIYQSATFRHPGVNQTTGYDYTRQQNPTREEVENTVAILENGQYGFAFTSGMSAISAILSLFRPGEHIIVSDDLYGGTYRLFETIYKCYGIEFSYVDTSQLNDVEQSIKSNTAAIFIETPSNPMMKVTDIRAITSLAKLNNLKVIVDNTFLTPYFQRPLELGADIVIHSGTKYLCGHNDTLAGFVVVNDSDIAERIRFIQKSVGSVLSPFDSWLILRGIKTLGIRMEKHEKNALEIAKWLKNHNKIEQVRYIGLSEHEGYNISKEQAYGFGGMISFVVKDKTLVNQVLERVKVILFAESLGGVESLITYPIIQTHSDIPEEMRQKIGINDRLLRLSVGIEDVEDIIADLEQALG